MFKNNNISFSIMMKNKFDHLNVIHDIQGLSQELKFVLHDNRDCNIVERNLLSLPSSVKNVENKTSSGKVVIS